MQRFSGSALRQARRAAHVRPERLAVEVARSVESIRGYEGGRIDPPASVVAALADALGVEAGSLFEVAS